MKAEKTLEDTRKLLEEHHQGHLLAFWDRLDPDQRQNLLAQIWGLDWAKIDDWVADYVKKAPLADVSRDLVPPDYYPARSQTRQSEYTRALEFGAELIAAGKVAAFVVAGGQGTRLGFDGPKGNLPISPVREKTLFRIFAETIAAAARRYGATSPWYIMTSPLNHGQTVDIFRSNDHYGLDPAEIFIFQQGTLPNFGVDGKILLAGKAAIAASPDGHGGSLKALHDSGALEDMKKRGIALISYWQIDNPLVNIFDPLFVGLHALDKADMSSKALVKSGPYEKVGNFCVGDGKLRVIEYTEFNEIEYIENGKEKELAEKTDPDGSLTFRLGSIAIHIISTAFVEKLNAKGFSLPIHRAVKKIPHIDGDGNPIEPDEPNAVKLETFIFDAIPLASKSIILETIREQEFAPTKNATGVDSVESTRRMMVNRSADWLESAGVTIPRKADGSPDCTLEIAPSFALYKADVRVKVDQVPEIRAGDELYLA